MGHRPTYSQSSFIPLCVGVWRRGCLLSTVSLEVWKSTAEIKDTDISSLTPIPGYRFPAEVNIDAKICYNYYWRRGEIYLNRATKYVMAGCIVASFYDLLLLIVLIIHVIPSQFSLNLMVWSLDWKDFFHWAEDFDPLAVHWCVGCKSEGSGCLLTL